jgi:hypothetical protein
MIQYTKTSSSDLVMCRKQSGIAIGRLCDKCDGKCPVCDSYVRPTTLVRICDECSFGNYQNKCVVCGGEVCLFWAPVTPESVLIFMAGHFGCFLLLRMHATGEGQRWMSKDHKLRLKPYRPVLPVCSVLPHILFTTNKRIEKRISETTSRIGLRAYPGWV